MQVDTFGCSFRSNHDLCRIAEVVYNGLPAVSSQRSCDARGACICLFPCLIDLFRIGVGIGTIEQHNLSGIAIGFEQFLEIGLGTVTFSKNERLLGLTMLALVLKGDIKCLEQTFAFGVRCNTQCKRVDGFQVVDFVLYRFYVFG